MNIATTKQRILQYIEFKGFSISKFFKDTGIKRGFLDSDKLNSSVSDQFITKIIATYLDLNPIWLLTGKGSMILSNYNTPDTINIVSESRSEYGTNTNKDLQISELKSQIKILQETLIMSASSRLCAKCKSSIK